MTKELKVLIAEDDIDDYLLLSEVITNELGKVKINWVKDGEDCLEFIYKKNKYANEPIHLPDLIFLDLNMPIKNGLEVLQVLKFDNAIKKIPVIVFSTSNADKDISDSYDCGANSYIIKPGDYDSYKRIAAVIHQYWLKNVCLPI